MGLAEVMRDWKNLASVAAELGKNPLSVDGGQPENLPDAFYRVSFPLDEGVLEIYYGDVDKKGFENPADGAFIDVKISSPEGPTKFVMYRWSKLSSDHESCLRKALRIVTSTEPRPHPKSYLNTHPMTDDQIELFEK